MWPLVTIMYQQIEVETRALTRLGIVLRIVGVALTFAYLLRGLRQYRVKYQTQTIFCLLGHKVIATIEVGVSPDARTGIQNILAAQGQEMRQCGYVDEINSFEILIFQFGIAVLEVIET